MSNLCSLSAVDMRKGLLQGDFSAVELCEQHFDRIEQTNENLNSYITICRDASLSLAKEADTKIQEQGEHTPTLTGVPVAIKDMLVTKGIETTCASHPSR